jgi:predicted nuclease of predicted toxin-antitoxin system
MRVLLDEGVPRPLARALRQHGVEADPFPNEWKRLLDGPLIDRAERLGYSVLITSDKNMPHQQSLKGRQLAVLLLPTNKLRSVIPMAPHIAQILPGLAAGGFTTT